MTVSPGSKPISFLLGLPALRDGALWQTALRLRAPVLISANALSCWRVDSVGLRCWAAFERRWLHLVARHPVALDSAGFVAARRYRGFPWDTNDYLDLAAAAPWLWWASQDWCVEHEVAHDESAALDRISGTIRLNLLCRNGGQQRGIAERFVPVIQGWHPDQYLRCLERMPWARDFPLVGIGSMCRRHFHGEHGILHVLDLLDRAFSGSDARFHLFGLKSQAIAILSQYSRVVSVDSQAYGVAARQDARKTRVPKSDSMLAGVMADWYRKQLHGIAVPPPMPAARAWSASVRAVPDNDIEARIALAAEELRALHETGEIDWDNLSSQAAYAFAFLDD